MVRHHVIVAAAALLPAGAVPGGVAVPPAATPIAAALPAGMRAGDLIFRAGRGWRADAVRAASVSRWTHVGIVDVDPAGRVFVIHAAPPEGDRGGVVLREPIARFAAPAAAEQVLVERLNLPAAAVAGMTADARGHAARRVPFDDAFDLGDAHALYCTELVWRSLWQAGVPVTPRTRTIAVPLMTGRYMTPDALRAMLPLRPLAPGVDMRAVPRP